MNREMKGWSVFWMYFIIMCLIGLGFTIVLVDKEWARPKMVIACGIIVGIATIILVVLSMWDYLAPLGVSGNGKLSGKEWVLILCVTDILLSPLLADLVIDITTKKTLGYPEIQNPGIMSAYVGYLISSMLPLAMV